MAVCEGFLACVLFEGLGVMPKIHVSNPRSGFAIYLPADLAREMLAKTDRWFAEIDQERRRVTLVKAAHNGGVGIYASPENSARPYRLGKAAHWPELFGMCELDADWLPEIPALEFTIPPMQELGSPKHVNRGAKRLRQASTAPLLDAGRIVPNTPRASERELKAIELLKLADTALEPFAWFEYCRQGFEMPGRPAPTDDAEIYGLNSMKGSAAIRVGDTRLAEKLQTAIKSFLQDLERDQHAPRLAAEAGTGGL